jgi:hypothetical protein
MEEKDPRVRRVGYVRFALWELLSLLAKQINQRFAGDRLQFEVERH